MARPLSRDEAVSILTRNEKEGLVIQVLNSRNIEAMCSCCSCCCGMLVALKLFPAQFRDPKSSYVCVSDALSCRGCGSCAGRCPVGASKIKDGKSVLREEKCIGCGLCVTSCPEQARSLVKKSPDRLYTPPESLFEAYADMSAERSKREGIDP
jgi:ferredoxin